MINTDMNNPLEQLKVEQALRSEQMKLEYRQANKPNEVNILDFTIIEALNKQIPQPIKKATFEDFGTIYGCPSCDYTDSLWSCGKHDKHCPDCGQKLDWSEK